MKMEKKKNILDIDSISVTRSTEPYDDGGKVNCLQIDDFDFTDDFLDTIGNNLYISMIC